MGEIIAGPASQFRMICLLQAAALTLGGTNIQPADATDDETRFRPRSRGTAWLYVLPCVWEDLLKLGISRDPLARMQTLHARYFEFFDLDRAFALRCDRVSEAQRLETAWRHDFKLHNAPAPLVIRRAAGGHREWFRGAFDALRIRARDCGNAGHELLDPLRPWVRDRLEQQAHLLASWTRTLDVCVLDACGPVRHGGSSLAALCNVLDAYAAAGLSLKRWLPEAVLRWYADRGGRDPAAAPPICSPA